MVKGVDVGNRSTLVSTRTSTPYVLFCVPWCCFCCMSRRDKKACRVWFWRKRAGSVKDRPQGEMELSPLMDNAERQQELQRYSDAKFRSMQRVDSSKKQRPKRRLKLPRVPLPWRKRKGSSKSTSSSSLSKASSARSSQNSRSSNRR